GGARERFGQDSWSAGHSELSDLLIHVSQVRNLENLRFRFERETAVGSEEAGARDTEFGIARRIQHMAAATGEKRVGNPAEEEILSGLLIRRERVVEPPDRIWRIRDLEREIGEGLHLIWRQLINPTAQAPRRASDVSLTYMSASPH